VSPRNSSSTKQVAVVGDITLPSPGKTLSVGLPLSVTPLAVEARKIEVVWMCDALPSLGDLTLSGSVAAQFPEVINPEGEVRRGYMHYGSGTDTWTCFS
jgi:hypothetical protein